MTLFNFRYRFLSEYRNDVTKLKLLVEKVRYIVSFFYTLQLHSPDNRALARECKDLKLDRVYIGSFMGGKLRIF